MNQNMAVLPVDFQEQQTKFEIGLACLEEMQEAFQCGNFEDVQICISDLVRSMSDIKRLQLKKQNREKIEAIISEMRSRGINIGFASKQKNAASAPTLTAR